MKIKKLLLTGLLTGAMAASAFAIDLGKIQIGSDLELDYIYSIKENAAALGGDLKKGNWKTSDIDLNVKAPIGKDAEFFLKLDLDDQEEAAGKGLVEEVGITFNNVLREGLSFKVGKQEVAFGGDYDVLVNDPYTHSFEIDNKYGITASMGLNDNFKLEVSSFQNEDGNNNTHADGTDEKSDDEGWFRSYSARLNYSMKDMLSASLSYSNQGTADDSKEDVKNVSIAAKFKPVSNLCLFGEYIMSQDYVNVNDNDVDVYQVGAKYDINKKCYVAATYEVKDFDKDNTTDQINVDKIGFGGCYKLDNGVKVMVDYALEDEDKTDEKNQYFGMRLGYNF